MIVQVNKETIATNNIFFSSDYHLSHNNVLKYDNRPFKTIEEHDEAIINNHNSVVGKNDVFFFLGDFSFNTKATVLKDFLSRLNGIKFFIKGNHDYNKTINSYNEFGTYLGQQSDIVIDYNLENEDNELQHIVLNHFPLRIWNKSYHNSYHLFGHVHGGLVDKPNGKSMDVGIMLNNYKPFSFKEIKNILDKF